MAAKQESRVKKRFSNGDITEGIFNNFKPGLSNYTGEGQGDGDQLSPMAEESLPESVQQDLVQQMEGLMIDPSHSHPHKEKGPCAVCGLPCKSYCSGCKKVFYCAKKHQQTHWAKHKMDCRPFSIPPQNPPVIMSKLRNSNNGKDDDSCPEMKYMVANRELEGGTALFSEKPLLITPNYPIKNEESSKKCLCLGCYKQFPIPGRFVPLDVCKKCLLPLCQDCLREIEGKEGKDCSHKIEECQAVADAVSKNRDFMTDKNKKLGHNAELIKDFCILRCLLLLNESSVRWQNFIDLKKNFRYSANVKFPTEEMKEWLKHVADYSISQNHLKSLKDSKIVLEEVIRIYVVFSAESYYHSHIRVLYPTQVWIPHGCTPNVQPYFQQGDTSHTIHVKTIDTIKADGIITMNYLSDYDEGNSKAAVRLFTSSGLYCIETRCPCRMTNIMDTSVGLRCNLFPTKDTMTSCPGCLAPVMEGPNPEKQSLGLLIYVKSKSWNCNKCRRSEKYITIQKQLKEIADKVKLDVEKYLKNPDSAGYARVKDLLSRHVSKDHWLYWKVCKTTLECWDKLVFEGYEMLKMVIGMPEGEMKSTIIKLITQKVEMYGNGISEPTLPKDLQIPGVLSLLARRHGRLSSKRAKYLYDAFFANLIVWAENFKRKFITLSNNSSSISEAITEGMRCLQILIGLLEEAATSQGLIPKLENVYKAKVCSQMLQVFKSVYAKAIKNRPNAIQYIREFLEIYAIQDAAFLSQTLPKFTPIKDEIDDLFDPEGRQYTQLTFGPAYGDSKKKTNEKQKDVKGQRKKFENLPAGDDPRDLYSDSDDDFGSFGDVLDDDDNEEEDDDENNPFTASMNYYEEMLNSSIREKLYAEQYLKNLFKGF